MSIPNLLSSGHFLLSVQPQLASGYAYSHHTYTLISMTTFLDQSHLSYMPLDILAFEISFIK